MTQKTLHENIQELRKKPETARVGLHYSREDNVRILHMASQGIPFNEIAKAHKRTTAAIRTRIAILVADIMRKTRMTLKEASEKYHISPQVLSKWYHEQCDKDIQKTKWFRDAVM